MVVLVVVVGVPPPEPEETLIVTFEPLSTSVPAGGFCPNTVPLGRVDEASWICGTRFTAVSFWTAAFWSRPTRAGTTTGFWPFETTSVTVAPSSAVTPAAGAWLTTMPFCLSTRRA